jgi:hypothetical protein
VNVAISDATSMRLLFAFFVDFEFNRDFFNSASLGNQLSECQPW